MKVEFDMLRLKRGVSLIMVLMFMLIATIAATATWKWISSEGKSSSSRMLQNEAQQSSIAGIEHARAWMTFNANETGALLRQYLYKPSGVRKKPTERTPINIDAQVRSFSNGAKQDHHVWLMEANTDTIPYRVKILSEGVSRNGQARHTEVAIFKISGLYQVLTDTTHVETHIPINFEYAYFGGSYNGAGDLSITSAVVNGNWQGNPQSISGNFIVTGNAILDGNNATVGPLMCVGGSASLGNQGITAQDMYIDEHISPLKGHITGDAYFGGTVKQSNTGAIVIDGSATVMGTFLSNQATNDYYTQISGNLCTGDSGMIVSKGETGDFLVGNDVWMPGDLNLWFGEVLGSECSCFSDVCVYKKCRCNGADCKEGTEGAVCEEAVYNGNCNDGDWLSHFSLTLNPSEDRRWYKLRKAKRAVACTGPDHEIVGCKNYTLYSDKTNYEIASNTHPNCKGNHSQCAKFILGNSNKSKAYIKSSQPSANYNSVLMAKVFDEPYDTDNYGNKPRSCKAGVTITDWWHNTQGVSCTKQYWHTGEKKEDQYRYRPYGEAPDGPENKKGKDPADTLYYMYSMPEGTTDVGFDSYLDDYWFGNNTHLWSYFVDFTEKSKATAFTNSYHTNSDGNHPAFVETASPIDSYNSTNKYYRLLNYTGKETSTERSNKITGTPYCKLAPGKNWRPQCGVNSWFVSKGTVSTNMNISNKPACAEDVKSACHSFWEKSDKGCDGAKYLVKDPIVTAKAKFEPYADYGCAKGIKTYNTDLVSQLNACYKRNVDNNLNDSLYNGFLVVKVKGGTSSTNPGGKLKGKFIVIAEEPLYTSFMDTEDDSYVFYYMEKGINTLNDATRKNTFIYSDGHIGSGNQFKLTGTIYVTASSCEGMDKLQGSTLTYDPVVTQVLSNACVICSNDGSVCGSKCEGNSGGGDPINPDNPEDDITTAADSILDPYFISNAPQLNVTIETQYQSSERSPTANTDEDLTPSFIVLPRIVHLCTDASGKLADYFNVVPLNGANLTKSDANVQCSPSLNVSSNLVSGGDTLAQDVYRCTATPTNYSAVPFYVWVYGSCAEDPAIRFEFPHIDLIENEDAEIRALIPPTGVTLATTCPPKPSEAWSIVRSAQFVSESNGICTFNFPGTGSSEYKTLFTVRVSEKVTEGMAFTLQIRDGYRLEEPWTTTLGMSEVTSECRDPATPEEISSFCSTNPDKCPPVKYRSYWKDCPNDDNDIIWVVPEWSHGYTTGAPPNDYWKIMGGDGILKLKENPGTGCIVIIPAENNSKGPPIPEDPENTSCLRASGKTGWHNVKLQFVGDVESGKNPFVHYNTDEFAELCHYDATDHSCTYPVFDGSKVNLSIDKEDAQNKGFSYWKCTGASCPTTDAVGSADFGTTGFTVNDDNTIIEIHFGEQDKHCFFDEFRRGDINCNVVGLDTAQYCIDDCMTHSANDKICTGANDDHGVFKKAKWHLLSGTLADIATSQYPSYITAASTAPDTGVKVISTVQAGTHGTLRALVQVPHLKSNLGRSSNRIRHSGFVLRSNVVGDEYLMLNVYENMSGHLEAQVCKHNTCLDPQELKDSVYNNPLSLSTSSLVMLSATLAGEDSLVVSAFLGDYYYGSSYTGPTKYKTLFKLSPNHSSETFSYVGFKLADKDFKLYGIGWRSDDYNSECFDGPPMVSCSYAAVAVDGIIETGKLTKPWVGYSGWFDNKNCSVEYWYYHGTDVEGCPAGNVSNICGTDGYNFMAGDEAGQHGYIDPITHEDIKTAKVNMSCGHDDNSVYAWSESADHTHCGPFWTGEYTECKTDIANLLGGEVSLSSDENRPFMFGESKNLRGETLVIELQNESEVEVNLEVALISKNTDWNGVEVVSRSINVSGHTKKIFSPNINAVESFANNTTTGFDPEHVVGILFTNHSEAAVVVANISAMCKNAIHCGDHCCSVELVGESTWQVKVRSDGQNMSRVGSIDVTVDVDGSTAPSLSTTAPCPGCYTINIPDADIFKNKGKPYLFYAKLNATDPEYAASLSEPEACGSITPSGITCTPKTIADINSGDSWPLFEVTLNHCPSSDCKYNVTMGKGSLTEYTVATGVEQPSGNHQYRYEGEPIECNDDGGCVYTYLLESTESDKPFSCSQSFTVRKKDAPVELSLDCSLSDQTGVPVNTPMTTSGTVTATGCESGCTWTITDNGTEVGNGTYGETPYSFTGATSAGTHSYVFNVKRTSDNAEQSCTAFSVEYVESSSDVFVCEYSGTSGGKVQGGVGNQNITSSTAPHQQYDLYIDGEKKVSGTWGLGFNFTTPTSLGNHSYKVTKMGESATQCHGSFEVVQPLLCEVANEVELNVQNTFKVSVMSGFSCSNCTYTNVDCGSSCGGVGVSDYTFTLTNSTPKELKAYCQCNDNIYQTCKQTVQAEGGGSGGGGSGGDESNSVTVEYGVYIKYEAGETYELTMAGGGKFRCTYNQQSSAVTIGTFGGSSFGAEANQSQATADNPGSGTKVTFVVDNDISGSLKCANDW
ncbi:hypothetical protein [Fibrobacter sp.]|uniref:hypothetical protein n=1 Tax=Fibrobacter sp. TaxID=35828 RepID=UPI00388E0266